MAYDMMKQLEMELAKRERGRSVDRPWWADVLTETIRQIPEQQERAAIYKQNQLTRTGSALDELLVAIDNPDSMDNFDAQLSVYEDDAKYSSSNKIKAMAIREKAGAKREMYDNFQRNVILGDKFIEGDQFLSEQSDFENINNTVDSLNKTLASQGKAQHAGALEFINSEVNKVNKMLQNIAPGFKMSEKGGVTGTNFRYNKANNSDNEVFKKLADYSGKLDLTAKMLIGDGIITPDEAQAILIGDETFYKETKTAASGDAEELYTLNRESYNYMDLLIARLSKAGQSLNQDAFNELVESIEGVDASTKEQMKAVSPKDGAKILENLKGTYKAQMDHANERYKYWTGRYFEEEITDNQKINGKNGDDENGSVDSFLDKIFGAEETKVDSTKVEEPKANVATRLNNPGNLKFAGQKDATGKNEKGFAVFPSEQKGWQALYNQINLDKKRDMTLKEFINKYAPPSENDTQAYIRSIERQLKVSRKNSIKSINTKELARAIAKQEGFQGGSPA